MGFSQKKQQIIEEAVRNEIFEVAVSILEEKGLSGLTIQNVAAGAGIATGTVYNYFKNKKDLLKFIHDKLTGDFMAEVAETLDEVDTCKEKLRRFIESLYLVSRKKEKIFVILEESLAIHEIDEDVCKECMNEIILLVQEILTLGVEKGEIKIDDVARKSQLVVGAMMGVLRTQYDIGDFDNERDSRDVFDLIRCYLGL